MFRTLRAKLVVSYILLLLLCLALSGGLAGVLLTRIQRRVNLERTRALAVGVAQRLRDQPALAARVPDLAERLRREGRRLNGHILLLDQRGNVVVDPQGAYEGERIPLAAPRPPLERLNPPNVRRHTFDDGSDAFVVYAELPGEQRRRTDARYLAIALAVREVNPPWSQLIRPLLLIGVFVALLGTGVSFWLAGSITRPVRQMTEAAAEMAQGCYDQQIEGGGRDEIGQLAASFSHMSGEVARAQRTQRDFLADVSHDLRTPLTSIRGFSQAILEGAVTDDAGYRRAARIIHNEADRMGRLVEDLLELARLEAGQLDLQPQPVAALDLLKTEIRQIEPRAEEAGQGIVRSLPGELPSIAADAERLRQAFTNLLDNAVKYAPPGTPIRVAAGTVSPADRRLDPLPVSYGASREAGEWIYMEIANQGDPIPSDELERVFDRFYRADASRGQSEGSGLGLAIVRETILAHGGAVAVGSDEEAGTRFRVWLPVTGDCPPR